MPRFILPTKGLVMQKMPPTVVIDPGTRRNGRVAPINAQIPQGPGSVVIDPGPGRTAKLSGISAQIPQGSGSYTYNAGSPYRLGDDAAPAPASSLSDIINSGNVSTAAAVAMTYHGYKRTGSLIWALIYGAAGKWFPLEAVPVAVAQGFGAKKGCP